MQQHAIYYKDISILAKVEGAARTFMSIGQMRPSLGQSHGL